MTKLLAKLILPWFLHANLDEFLNKLVRRLQHQDFKLKELETRLRGQDAVIAEHVKMVREAVKLMKV